VQRRPDGLNLIVLKEPKPARLLAGWHHRHLERISTALH